MNLKNRNLTPRKPDLLDELNNLRKSRGIAYRTGNIKELGLVHTKMKAFWIRNGWSKNEAESEYERHVRECEVPYSRPVGHSSIRHEVYDRQMGRILQIPSIAELSDFWFNQQNYDSMNFNTELPNYS